MNNLMEGMDPASLMQGMGAIADLSATLQRIELHLSYQSQALTSLAGHVDAETGQEVTGLIGRLLDAQETQNQMLTAAMEKFGSPFSLLRGSKS